MNGGYGFEAGWSWRWDWGCIWFTGVESVPAKPETEVLEFSGSAFLDYVELTPADGTLFPYGGTGGTAPSIAPLCCYAENEDYVEKLLSLCYNKH